MTNKKDYASLDREDSQSSKHMNREGEVQHIGKAHVQYA